MYQYYIMEIQQYQTGEYGDIKHFAYDEDQDTARMKAESKYHEVLSAAAISDCLTHSAILFTAEGVPVLHQCYRHKAQEVENGNT